MFIRSIINFRGPTLHTEKLLHSEHGFNCIVQETTQFGEHFACFIRETGYPGQHEYMKIVTDTKPQQNTCNLAIVEDEG